ncbi:MAG: hypothetical protein WCG78_07635, partial [Candidatus Omnitrophota bacterium]
SVAWACPEICSVRPCALAERPQARMTLAEKCYVAGLPAGILAVLAVSSLIFGPQSVLNFFQKTVWAKYYKAYYLLCGVVVGNGIASCIDKDKHWSRYAVMTVLLTISAFLVPLYCGWTRQLVPDLGSWSHSLRPLADVYVMAQPPTIFYMLVMGLRERVVDAFRHQERIFSKEWMRQTFAYEQQKLALYFSKSGIFKLITLFWPIIIHFTYYDMPLTTMVGISATVMPAYAVMNALYLTQRPGRELTRIPWLNKLIINSYLVPVWGVAAVAGVAACAGSFDTAVKCCWALSTAALSQVVYRSVTGALRRIFPSIKEQDTLVRREKKEGGSIAAVRSRAAALIKSVRAYKVFVPRPEPCLGQECI